MHRPRTHRASRGHGKDRLIDVGARLKDVKLPASPLPPYLKDILESVRQEKLANAKARA